LRSERVARRILRTLISFAYQPNPTLNDYAAYAQAVSEEFDRVHATLTREEREDPLVWAIVEEVQEAASSDPTGRVIYNRLAQLGREPWQLQRGSLTIDGEEEEAWVEDESEGNEESESDEGSGEASQEDSSEEEDFPRSQRRRAPSLPEIEDIDRDEDEPPTPVHNWIGGSEEEGGRRWNRATTVTESEVDAVVQERLDRLAENFLGSLGRYDGSDEEDDDEEEEEVDSDGGHTTDRVRRMAEIGERVEGNPLRRPRHPRTRPPAAPSTSSWSYETPPPPRSTTRPYFRTLPPSNSLTTFRPGLQGHLSMFDHARDIRGPPPTINDPPRSPSPVAVAASEQQDTLENFPTSLRSLLSHLCRRTGYEPQPEDTIDELGSIAFERPDKPLEAFVADLSDFDQQIIDRIRVQFSAFIACDIPPGTELAVQQDMMRMFGYEGSPVMLEVCLIMNEASDQVQQEWERYVDRVIGRQDVDDAQGGLESEEEEEAEAEVEPRFMDNRPYEVREAEAIRQAMQARFQLPDLSQPRPSPPPAAEEEEEEQEVQWESHGHFISPDGQPYTVSRAEAIAFLIAQGQEEEDEPDEDEESDESESHAEIMRRIRQNFNIPSLDSLGHGQREEIDVEEEEGVDSDDSTTHSEIMRRIRQNYYLPDLDSRGREIEQRSTRTRAEEEEEEDSPAEEEQELINEYMTRHLLEEVRRSRAEQARPNPSSPSINPYVASGEIDDEIPRPQHPYRTNNMIFTSDPQELRRQIESERESLRDFYDELD